MPTNDIDIKDEDLKEDDFTPEELEAEDVDWKAKAQELKGIAKRRATQLSKAKEKLSGYETELTTLKQKPPEKKEDKPDEIELLNQKMEKLALKSSGIQTAEETQLFEKWKGDTGRDADAIISNPIFQKELEGLRIAKANQDATSNVKGETGGSGVKNTPDYWIAKATKGSDGQLLFPEEMPKELYVKVMDKLVEQDPNHPKELKFYNQK